MPNWSELPGERRACRSGQLLWRPPGGPAPGMYCWFDKWWQLKLFIEIEFSNQTEDGKHRAVLETAPGKRGCHWCLASQSVKYEKTFLFWFLNNQEPWRRSRRSSQSSERRTRSWRKRFCKPIYFSSGKASSTTVSSKSLSTWVSWMMIDNCCVCRFLCNFVSALTKPATITEVWPLWWCSKMQSTMILLSV